jgi:hypothetical protein
LSGIETRKTIGKALAAEQRYAFLFFIPSFELVNVGPVSLWVG